VQEAKEKSRDTARTPQDSPSAAGSDGAEAGPQSFAATNSKRGRMQAAGTPKRNDVSVD